MRIELNEFNLNLTERIIRNKIPVAVTDTTLIALRDENDLVLFSVDTQDMSKSEIVRKVRSLLELYA